MNRLAKGLLIFLVGIAAIPAIAKSVATKSESKNHLETSERDVAQALEGRLRAVKPNSATPAAQDWVKNALVLSRFVKAQGTVIQEMVTNEDEIGCQSPEWVEFAGTYVLTRNATTKKPCHIYDLSFPTLQTIFTPNAQVVSKLPVMRLTARDYLNWINGNYHEIYQKQLAFRDSFEPQTAATSSWIAQVQFRSERRSQLTWVGTAGPNGLPREFTAADLEIGSRFSFSDRERRLLTGLIEQMKMSSQSQGSQDLEADGWSLAISNPKEFLKQMKFVWNDLEKVYNVVLAGKFLPLAGPVQIINFQRPYQPVLEAMIRNVLQSALERITQFIPGLVTRRVVQVALADSFDFLNGMYTYQMNHLERSLRAGLKGEDTFLLAPQIMEQSINLIFATRSNLMTEYISSVAQGKKFEWDKIEKIGIKARYQSEKQREATMNTLNSGLVTKYGCQTQSAYDYFVTCSEKRGRKELYSILSETSVLIWSFGAALVHRYDRPSEVSLKRATSWLLSAGLRLTTLPLISSLSGTLSAQLKAFAMTGLNDEAFLKATLRTEKRLQKNLSDEEVSMLKWLYIQNINPFLPKTEAVEVTIIGKNRELLHRRLETAASATLN